MKDAFISKFQARRAQVAVIGLGYVGLPLAVNFAKAGYQVIGIDLDQRKVDAIIAADRILAIFLPMNWRRMSRPLCCNGKAQSMAP